MSIEPIKESIDTTIVKPVMPCLNCFKDGIASTLDIKPAGSNIEGLIDGKCPKCGFEIFNYTVLRYINRPDFDAIRKERDVKK
jgi:hypothetical protein